MDLGNSGCCPLKLKYTRIRRNYRGGLLLEQWQKNKDAKDGNFPEEWVASTVEARESDSKVNDGLSLVVQDTGSEIFLRDIISQNPEELLGRAHVKKYHCNPAILVKIIDSCSRLYLQVHPDRNFAKRVFGSDFGKTEAWYILGGRNINGCKPYVLLGFKKGITKEIWKNMFDKQDIDGMVDSLNRFTVKPGDIFFIESGVPHAIGSGCFLIEAQEPTDYTFRVERFTPEGKQLPEFFNHQGVGFDNMLESFHYDTYTREEILDKFYLKPSVIERQEGGIVTSIISPQYSQYFTMRKLDVTGTLYSKKGDSFGVAVITSGTGKLLWDKGEMDLEQADELFLPANLKDMIWRSYDHEKLEIIICYPPK